MYSNDVLLFYHVNNDKIMKSTLRFIIFKVAYTQYTFVLITVSISML